MNKQIREVEKIMKLDSRYASYNGDYDFYFSLNEEVRNCVGIEIINASIPWMWTNVMSGINNQLDFKDTIERHVTIPEGEYDESSLLIAIKNALDSTSTSNIYEITLSDTNSKITIKMSPVSSPLLLHASSSIASVIGLTTDTLITSSSQLQYPIKLIFTDYLELRLPNNFIKSIECSNIVGSNNDLLTAITLSGAAYGDRISLGDMNTIKMVPLQRNFRNITISLTDMFGVTLPSLYDTVNFPWMLVFKLTILE